MTRPLDIIIMGATGITGMHCIPFMDKLARYNEYDFNWGIAGRSEEKMRSVLHNTGKKIGKDLSTIPICICDIENEHSMVKMTQKTRLVINCVGPYILYGEKVVNACLQSKTHYIDACGEPQFMEQMQLTKNNLAKAKSVYVISACGFDSIPCDLGVTHLARQFNGVLNSVVTYLELFIDRSLVNYATWESLVHNVSRIKELKKIRKALFKEKAPILEPKLKVNLYPHRTNIVDGWIIPFPGADKSVMKRTQAYFHETEHKRPIQIESFLVFKQAKNVLLMAVTANIFTLFTKFQGGRKLLLDHPEIFSCGLFTKSPLTQEIRENSRFQITFYGEGWVRKEPKEAVSYSEPCNKKIVARMSGRNPAYESTGLILIASAITLLSEIDKLPENGKGGVYTPGAAFAKTSIMQLLLNNGITFEIMPEEDIVSSKL